MRLIVRPSMAWALKRVAPGGGLCQRARWGAQGATQHKNKTREENDEHRVPL